MITKQTGGARQRPPIVERRTNLQQRERFETAMAMLKPVLERSAANDTMMYLVMQRLQSAYPELSAGDVEALLSSVIRTLKKKDAGPKLVVSN
ncbi:MAG: hypothetical protein H6935_09535 [Thiobacillus sp.]|nr:hypothetical protein [Thiobacillus sp.]